MSAETVLTKYRIDKLIKFIKRHCIDDKECFYKSVWEE